MVVHTCVCVCVCVCECLSPPVDLSEVDPVIRPQALQQPNFGGQEADVGEMVHQLLTWGSVDYVIHVNKLRYGTSNLIR